MTEYHVAVDHIDPDTLALTTTYLSSHENPKTTRKKLPHPHRQPPNIRLPAPEAR